MATVKYDGFERNVEDRVRAGHLNKWMAYEVSKIETKYPDGKKTTCYRMWVDGEWEIDLNTIAAMDRYIKELKASFERGDY